MENGKDGDYLTDVLTGKVKAWLKVDEPVISTDLYPTILDLVGLPLRLAK